MKSTIDNEEIQEHIASVISSQWLPTSDARLQKIMEAQENQHPDQTVLLRGMVRQLLFKRCYEAVLFREGWTVSGVEHSIQSIQDRTPALFSDQDSAEKPKI